MKEILLPFSLGLIIFLFGLQLMKLGLEKLAGNRLKDVLLRFTKTPFRSFVTGIISTALLQSSSAVTVLTIGFVNAEIISFAHSIGIILGTNIGTTVTTEILALKIEDFAVPLMIIGTIIYLIPFKFFSQLGFVFGGFGCIFLGMDMMKWVANPLKENEWMNHLIHLGHPILIGILVGALITALIHSSSATIAIAMGFYASGILSLPFAVAVVFGSNIGTCATGLLATINTNRAAKQVALSHIILNAGGVILFSPFIPFFSHYIPMLSENPATQIAHVQTLFNIICSLAVLPFAAPFAHGINTLIPYQSPIHPK